MDLATERPGRRGLSPPRIESPGSWHGEGLRESGHGSAFIKGSRTGAGAGAASRPAAPLSPLSSSWETGRFMEAGQAGAGDGGPGERGIWGGALLGSELLPLLRAVGSLTQKTSPAVGPSNLWGGTVYLRKLPVCRLMEELSGIPPVSGRPSPMKETASS